MKKILSLFALLLSFSAFAYDFNINDKTITYNPDTLKFQENSITLSKEEVQELFPDYQIILISKFNKEKKYTIKNSLFKSKKILLLNDDTRTFHRFYIYPESSRDEFQDYKNGEIKSLITIYGKKNARLKHEGGDEFEIVVK
ncbi:hypothetical protein IJ425_01830 [bacterium]|nr:hypothetical protein [bacterium]